MTMDLSQAREIDDDAMNSKHTSDARVALRTLEKLRAAGHQPHTVTVGSVTIGLCVPVPVTYDPVPESKPDEEPARTKRKIKPEPNIYEEHGADLLNELTDSQSQQGDRDDDE